MIFHWFDEGLTVNDKGGGHFLKSYQLSLLDCHRSSNRSYFNDVVTFIESYTLSNASRRQLGISARVDSDVSALILYVASNLKCRLVWAVSVQVLTLYRLGCRREDCWSWWGCLWNCCWPKDWKKDEKVSKSPTSISMFRVNTCMFEEKIYMHLFYYLLPHDYLSIHQNYLNNSIKNVLCLGYISFTDGQWSMLTSYRKSYNFNCYHTARYWK